MSFTENRGEVSLSGSWGWENSSCTRLICWYWYSSTPPSSLSVHVYATISVILALVLLLLSEVSLSSHTSLNSTLSFNSALPSQLYLRLSTTLPLNHPPLSTILPLNHPPLSLSTTFPGLVFRSDLVGTGRVISIFFGINGVRSKRSHLVGPPFPEFKARFQLWEVGISPET